MLPCRSRLGRADMTMMGETVRGQGVGGPPPPAGGEGAATATSPERWGRISDQHASLEHHAGRSRPGRTSPGSLEREQDGRDDRDTQPLASSSACWVPEEVMLDPGQREFTDGDETAQELVTWVGPISTGSEYERASRP